MDPQAQPDGPGDSVRVVERILKAPREPVSNACARTEQLARWFGVHDCSPACDFDVPAGGRFRFHMREPGGTHHWLEGT
jgi:uncharacterized protein YndB with AHSA1/START domain